MLADLQSPAPSHYKAPKLRVIGCVREAPACFLQRRRIWKTTFQMKALRPVHGKHMRWTPKEANSKSKKKEKSFM